MISTKLNTQEKFYRPIAGSLYLIIAIIGGFSIGYMPSVIVVDGNAALTFENLTNHQNLFKWGIVGDILVIILETILTVMIYQLFKSISATGATIAAYSRLAMAIIMGMNLLNYAIPQIIVTHPEYLDTFNLNQLEALNLLFFKAHKFGEMAWQLFFAIHLFTLGYVVRKSIETPKWLGDMMMIGGIGYGGDSFIQLVSLNSESISILFSILLVFAVIGELWFAFWLLIKGMKKSE